MVATPASSIDRVTVLVDASRADFFHPPLDTYHPARYISPNITQRVADQLGRRSVIVCAGDSFADLLDIVRHVAWYVTRPNASKIGSLRRLVNVQEWAAAAAGKQRIHQALLSYEEPTLFILPRLLPKHIDYDFNTLIAASRHREHVILATTDMALTWERQLMRFELLQPHWLPLRSNEIYDTTALAKDFIRAIIDAKQRLPSDFVLRVVRTNNVAGTLSAVQLASKLRRPSQIQELVEQICAASETQEITEDLIQRLQTSVTDEGRRLRSWFLNLSNTREQLLMLAMTMFDGLAEDQFFAVFDILVDRTWGRRDPNLRGIDYADTDGLHQYVGFRKADRGEVINATMDDQRRILIKQTWEQYRRHILSTLPILIELVRNSVEPIMTDPALGGSSERRDNLRTVISNTLSDIGYANPLVVEEALLQLALDRHVEIQSVAARAVARWRDRDDNQHMSAVLTSWREANLALEAKVRGIVEAQATRYGDYEQAWHNLHQTVLLTIGYAAQFERPNEIPKLLFDDLKLAADGEDTDVLRFFCAYVLPLLLNKHLDQVSQLIPQLASNRLLHDVIAQGLAQVYEANSGAIENLLADWYDYTKTDLGKFITQDQFRRRTDLLGCVLTCYGYLPYTAERLKPVFERIQVVLMHEQEELVRVSAINALFRLAGDNVELIREQLGLLQHHQIRQMTEIDLAVDTLVTIGKRQREVQKGGDQVKFLDTEQQYVSLWVTQVRPPTQLEQTLLIWVQDYHHIVAQQLAVRVLVAITAHYRNDEERRWRALSRRRHPYQRSRQTWRERLRQSAGGLHPFSFYNYLVVPPGVALMSSRHRRIVRNVLPELIDLSAQTELPIAWLYGRLEEMDQGDRDLYILAKRLEQAVRWSRVRGFVKFILFIMMVCTVFLLLWGFGMIRR